LRNSREVHPTSIIGKNVKLGKNVIIKPYAIIEDDVEIGDFTEIGPFVHIYRDVKIGKNCKIFDGVIIGAAPQDLNYKGESTNVVIGDNNVIHEYTTIHKATGEGNSTIIGNGNFIMAYVHIAHNCLIEDNVIVANGAQIAGYVKIERNAFISGLCAVHQFVRIGSYTMIGGKCRVPNDVVPFSLIAGEPPRLIDVNRVGLRRAGFSHEAIDVLHRAMKILRERTSIPERIEKIKNELPQTKEIQHLINFLTSKRRRGLIM